MGIRKRHGDGVRVKKEREEMGGKRGWGLGGDLLMDGRWGEGEGGEVRSGRWGIGGGREAVREC